MKGEREEKENKYAGGAAMVLRLVEWMSHRFSAYIFSLYREKIFFHFHPVAIASQTTRESCIMFTSKKALLLIANGSEESEVVITIDVSSLEKS